MIPVEEQPQEKHLRAPDALGHRSTVTVCLKRLDSVGHLTLQAHAHATVRIIALAEQVLLLAAICCNGV
jgi:hypothetical protein